MAISYAAAGTGVSVLGTGTLSPAADAGVASGDILVMHVLYRGTAETPTSDPPAGWTLLDGPRDVGTAVAGRTWVYGKIADGTEDTAPDACLATGTSIEKAARVYRFTGRISGTIQQLIIAASFDYVAHANDPQGVSVTTNVAGDRAVCFTMQTDNNVLEAIAGMSGGTWVEHTTYAPALTTGLCMDIQSCIPTANPGTVSGGAETVTNDPAATVGFEIKQQPFVISRTLTNAPETDTPQALSFTKTIYKSLTYAAESDTPQAIAFIQPNSIVAAVETDSPEILSVTKTIYKSLTNSPETEIAQTLSVTKTIYENIVNTAEIDSAQSISIDKSAGIVFASETDASQSISFTQAGALDLVAATETDSVQSLSFTKTIYESLSFVSETDSSQILSITKTIYKSLVITDETDTAQILPLVLTQKLNPSIDSVDGQWLNDDNGTELFSYIDEPAYSDSDYIKSELGATYSGTRMKLEAGETPESGTRTLRVRAAKDAADGDQVDLVLKLYEGGGDVLGAGTLIHTITATNISNSFVTFEEEVTNAITNYSNLYIELEANTP